MGKRYSDDDAVVSSNIYQDFDDIKKVGKGINKNIKIILLIALIPIIGVGSYFGYNFYKEYKNKNNVVVPAVSDAEKENEPEGKYVGGYKVIGNLKIDKISLNTDILDPEIEGVKYVDDALKFGIVKFYGEEVNKVGNFCIIGHNTSNFINLKDLAIGDEITLSNENGYEMSYIVTEIMHVSPDDLTVLLPNEYETELTLITCEEGATTRLVVKAINN